MSSIKWDFAATYDLGSFTITVSSEGVSIDNNEGLIVSIAYEDIQGMLRVAKELGYVKED